MFIKVCLHVSFNLIVCILELENSMTIAKIVELINLRHSLLRHCEPLGL